VAKKMISKTEALKVISKEIAEWKEEKNGVAPATRGAMEALRRVKTGIAALGLLAILLR